MSSTKYLKGPCQHCGGNLEFPAEIIGTELQCPHCGQQTELVLGLPPEAPALPRQAILWTLIALLILGLGLVGTLVALNRAQKLAERQRAAALPQPQHPKTESPEVMAGFETSPIHLEKTEDNSLVYAMGTLQNQVDRQRFGVRVEIELLDAAGNKVGVTRDYQQVIESRAVKPRVPSAFKM